MATDKYDLHTIDYSVQGWDSILATDMEKLDDVIQSRLLITLGETVALGDAIYVTSDTKFYKNLADYRKQPVCGLTLESGDLNDVIRVQRVGLITVAGWSWSVGKLVYLSSDTEGELTQTVPSVYKQMIGIAVASDKIILFGGTHVEDEIICLDNEVVCMDNKVITI